jgi:hypothetical protein
MLVIRRKSLLAYLVIILIQISNDINPNPGPDATIYPCGTCDQPVTCLSGVDACIGLMLFDGVGLAREVSDRTL